MKKKKTRAIKHIKRYNAGALLSSLFLLLASAGIIVGLLYLPLFRYDVGNEASKIFATDFLLDAYARLMGESIGEVSAAYTSFTTNFVNGTLAGLWAPLGNYFVYGVSVLIALVVVFAGIGFITGLLCMAVGYIAGGYRAPKIMCAINFWFALFMALAPVACHTILQVQSNPGGQYIWASYGLIFPAALFIVWLIDKLIYVFALKDRVPYKHLDKIVAQRNEELSHRRSQGNVNNNEVAAANNVKKSKKNKKKGKDQPEDPKEDGLLDFSDEEEFDHFCDRYGSSERKPVVEVVPSLINNEEEKMEYDPTPFVTPDKEQDLLKPKMEVDENEDTSVVFFDESKGLPNDVYDLGDHSFAKNLKLEVANIPDGIDEIGPACFANCLNLRFVKIPNTVKTIRFNAFFGCKKLTTINYEGTRNEWRAINRGSNWLTGAGTDIVVCKDGSLKVNPIH